MATVGGNGYNPVFQPVDTNGDPYSGGLLETFLAGTSTPQVVFLDQNLTSPAANPIVLDSAGKATFWLGAFNYKFIFKNSSGVEQFTVDGVQDIAQLNFGQFGFLQASGASAVVSGYTILTTDKLVTVNSSGGPNPCVINLQLASVKREMLTIKNLGTIPLAITPQVGDSIESIAAAFTVPAAASPDFPSVLMAADGTTDWWVLASHKG